MLKKKLYEDWKFEIISKDDYLEYSKEYDLTIARLTENLDNLNKQVETIKESGNKDSTKWMEEFEKNKNITELSKEVIDNLIDNIYVHESDVTPRITIVFKYEDEYKKALEFIKKNSTSKLNC